MKQLVRVVDTGNSRSLSSGLRRKRFALFEQLLSELPMPMTILDVGGTQSFWEIMDFADRPGVHITLLNITEPKIRSRGFTGVVGNATAMVEFNENQFDVVFSNSVIEHVGDYAQQERMANEIMRVGKRYFLQTPNYYFPIEPHFLFPGFQWLPLATRAWLINHFTLGWVKQIHDKHQAWDKVKNIRLLTKAELLSLFPGANLYHERFVGLVKSFIVYDGWQSQ